MQKARSQSSPYGEPHGQPPTACRHVVSGALSLPAQGCFSPVPHGTRPLSVTRESLALEGGPPSFTPGLSYRALLRNTATRVILAFVYRALTVSGPPFQGSSTGTHSRVRRSYNPDAIKTSVWAWVRFARRYSGHLG